MTYFVIYFVLCILYTTNGFDLGVTGTKCSLNKAPEYDTCLSLYGAVCDGAHCKCPIGTVEDKFLKFCQKEKAPSGSSKPKGGSRFDDLPFDYIPGAKHDPNKSASTTTARPNPFLSVSTSTSKPGYSGGGPKAPDKSGKYPHKPILFPDDPKYGGNRPSGRDNFYGGDSPKNPSGYPAPPDRYPGHAGIYPDSSGRYPNQPGYNPNKPGYPSGKDNGHLYNDPNKLDNYGHGHHHKHNTHYGQKTGGGIGGALSFLILIGLIYFCCCRGDKGRNLRSKFPFGTRGGATINQPTSVTYQMQPVPIQQPGQQVYAPQPGQIYAPTQPGQVYVPPQGGQVYAQVPAGQVYIPQQAGQVYVPQPQPPVIGFSSPPPPYSPEYKASAPPPSA